jgi:hypothetical protein
MDVIKRKKTAQLILFGSISAFLLLYTIVLFIPIGILIFQDIQKNDTIRNKIVFKHQTRDVRDSLRVMNSLLDRMPYYQLGCHYGVLGKTGMLNVHCREIGFIDTLYGNQHLDTIKEFKGCSISDIRRFLNLVKYLKEDKITAALDGRYSSYQYVYREFSSTLFADDELFERYIIVLKGRHVLYDANFLKFSKVYEEKDHLVLFGPAVKRRRVQ